MKLKNITYAIQENASTLDNQIQSFDSAAKSYVETKSEEELSNLLRTIKKVGKTQKVHAFHHGLFSLQRGGIKNNLD